MIEVRSNGVEVYLVSTLCLRRHVIVLLSKSCMLIHSEETLRAKKMQLHYY